MIRAKILSLMLATTATLTVGCDSSNLDSDESALKIRAEIPCLEANDVDVMTRQVLDLVNLERAAANLGLQPVTVSRKLTWIAEDYACRLIEEGFFDHIDPETGHGPGDRAVAGKYRFYAIGENLAAGPQTAAEVMDLWMESPAHRAIILDPSWTEMGLGLRNGGDYGLYWVQVFGLPVLDF
ncbi:MAG: CAP domain-containing protein [Planctomycetota bacterium]|jgi:uncharacterized protein YkwD